MAHSIDRRGFIKVSAAYGGGLWVVGSGSGLRAGTANETPNIACVGVGGQGGSHVEGLPKNGGKIVALVDVDDNMLDEASKKQPGAKRFKDFRKMLDAMSKDIDGVCVATPDHTHAVAANAAMLLGKGCYCEKPLTHSIHEARTLTETAKRMKVATQMGNQGQSGDGTRRVVEIVRSGAIGAVKEVHAWTDRPIWPQGIDRPSREDGVPPSLDWDLWIGPAPMRPFVKDAYHTFAWRGWWDFGTGALGDMACHILNAAYWALDLKYPTSIEVLEGGPRKPENGPKSEVLRYHFPARGDMPPVAVTWHDGGRKPPAELFEGEEIKDGGCILVGEKGKLYVTNDYGGGHTLLPKKNYEGYKNPPETLKRSPGHHRDWIEAIKDPSRPACSDFSYSGPLTEMVLLGVAAFRVGKTIEWDGPNMRATNASEAEAFIKPPYRAGWSLGG